MGMLDTLTNIGGMLGGMAPGIAYLQSRKMGGDPIQALAAMQQMSADKQYKQYIQEQRMRAAEEEERRREQARQAQIALEAQQAAFGELGAIPPEQRQAWLSNPVNAMRLYAPGTDAGMTQGVLGAMAQPAQPLDKNIGNYVDADGYQVETFQKADGTVYNVRVGKARDRKSQEPDKPSDQRLYEWFNSLPKEQQEAFLRMRGGPDKPSSQAEKFVTNAIEQQRLAQEQASKIDTLADGMSQIPDDQWSAGWKGQLKEYGKRAFGIEDNVTVIQTLANEVRMAKSLGILPPGVASDRDVALALSTTLPPTANKQALLSWLSGAKKISQVRAQYESFKLNHMQNDPTTGLMTFAPAWQRYSEGLTLPEQSEDDLTQYTDEQLRAIAEGNAP